MPISRFAAYCGTTRQTLQHYDHIGLLKPAEVGEQGYRYYEALQGYDFRLINSLRRGGCTLDEVAEILNSGDERQMEQLLVQKEEALREELLRVQQEQALLRFTAGTLRFMLQFVTNEPVVMHFEREVRVLYFPFDDSTRYGDGIYKTQIDFAAFCAAHGSIQPYPYFFVLTKEEIMSGERRFRGICCPYSGPDIPGLDLRTVPGGDYVILRVQPLGEPTDRRDAYDRLAAFLKKHGYRVCGDCFEMPVLVPKGQRKGIYFPVLHALRVEKGEQHGNE